MKRLILWFKRWRYRKRLERVKIGIAYMRDDGTLEIRYPSEANPVFGYATTDSVPLNDGSGHSIVEVRIP